MTYYVGMKASVRNVFWADETPTPVSTMHAVTGGYDAVWGPFRTLRGARFGAAHGQGNPHAQTVSDAERIAKTHDCSQCDHMRDNYAPIAV